MENTEYVIEEGELTVLQVVFPMANMDGHQRDQRGELRSWRSLQDILHFDEVCGDFAIWSSRYLLFFERDYHTRGIVVACFDSDLD